MRTISADRKGAKADSRVALVTRQIRELAFSKGPDWKLPTFRELCGSLEASPTTLLGALDELEARNVICRKDRSGIYVSPKLYEKSARIFFNSGLITRKGLSPFWGILSGLILSEAQSRVVDDQVTYHFEFLPAAQFHDPLMVGRLTKLVREAMVHGIMSVGMGEQPTTREFDREIPLVHYADSGQWQVRADTKEAGRMAIGSLVRSGCSKIGVWRCPEQDDTVAEPLIPAIEPLFHEYGVGFHPELILYGREFLNGAHETKDLTLQERGYVIAHHAFARPGLKPDGLFLSDDMFAEGVLTALNELSIKPGSDIQIVSMCNAGSPILFGYEDLLTFVEVDPAKLVSALFNVLEMLMSGAEPTPDMLWVSPRLISPEDHVRRKEIMNRFGL